MFADWHRVFYVLDAPKELELSKDVLMNILEEAREDVKRQNIDDLNRAKQAGKTRVPFNQPTESVRLLSSEASAFMKGSKQFLKRELAG